MSSEFKGNHNVSLAPQHVKIGGVELVGGNFRKHIKYTIELDNRDPVERRYSDFLWMRNQLQKLFPCVFIPPIPPKKPMALWPTGYLDFRRRELERFLNRLVKKPFVCSSKPFLVFMCRPCDQLAEGQKNSGIEVARITRAWGTQTNRLKEAFPAVFTRSPPLDIETEIEGTREYLKKMNARMKAVLSAGEKLHAMATKMANLATEFSSAIDLARADEVYLPPSVKKSQKQIDHEKAHDRSELLDIGDVYTRTCFPSQDLFGPRLLSGIKEELGDVEAFLELFTRWEEIKSLSRKATQDASQWHTPHGPTSSKSHDRKIAELRSETELRAFFLTCTQLLQAQFEMMWDHNSRRHHGNVVKFAESQASHHDKAAMIWKESVDSISHKSSAKGPKGGQEDDVDENNTAATQSESQSQPQPQSSSASKSPPAAAAADRDETESWTPKLAGIDETKSSGSTSPLPIPIFPDSIRSRDSVYANTQLQGIGRGVSITPRSADLDYFNPLKLNSSDESNGSAQELGNENLTPTAISALS